jgi:hypothetical protein
LISLIVALPTLDGRLVPQISAVGSTVYSLDYNNSIIDEWNFYGYPGTSANLFCFMRDIKYL